jgi:cyclophilin family peptidyl-prolyl cis-trans isomerase
MYLASFLGYRGMSSSLLPMANAEPNAALSRFFIKNYQ